MDSIDAGQLAPLMRELKTVTKQRLDDHEKSINELFARGQRPGAERGGDCGGERKDLADWCVLKHSLDQPRDDGVLALWEPSSAEIDDARIGPAGL